jgi:hypothetical protein
MGPDCMESKSAIQMARKRDGRKEVGPMRLSPSWQALPIHASSGNMTNPRRRIYELSYI